jgi:hypothetical protein
LATAERTCASAWPARITRPADRDLIHAQRRLADADRDAMAVLAAGTDAGVELEVVAEPADLVEAVGLLPISIAPLSAKRRDAVKLARQQ